MHNQIPTDIPVKLIRHYHGKTGNLYMPGEYEPGSLPQAAYNSYYVIPLVVLTPKESTPASEPAEIPDGGSFKVENLVKKEENNGLIEEVSINQLTKNQDKHIKAKVSKPVVVPSLNVNTANFEDLKALHGVGKVTAERIIEMRELSAFTSYDDLNERNPLPLGRDWTSFDLSFSE